MKDKNLTLLERLGIRSAEPSGPKWKRFLRDRRQKKDRTDENTLKS